MDTVKYIFTDFDGVLHPVTAKECERFSNAGKLLEAIAGYEDEVRVVITSSHRHGYELSALKALLPRPLAKLVVGITPRCKGKFPRYEEIRAYIDQHAPGADWCALDDEPMIFPKPCEQLILCNSFVGLDELGVGGLRRWLAGELAE